MAAHFIFSLFTTSFHLTAIGRLQKPLMCMLLLLFAWHGSFELARRGTRYDGTRSRRHRLARWSHLYVLISTTLRPRWPYRLQSATWEARTQITTSAISLRSSTAS